jgi:HNH endonuclease
MPICIYCRTRADGPFPKEHVVPQAFGRFLDNLTLQCVCGVCNSFFDRELEVFLTRDSVEALLRVRYGLKTKSGRRKLGTSRLTIRVISPGDWYGARIRTERNAEGTEIKGEPLPQVGFRKFGETERKWFLEDELENKRAWERYRTDAETHIVGQPDAAVQRLVEKLLKFGIVFKKRGTPEKHGGPVQVFAESILDDIIFRGVAKIAFNFLAYIRNVDFVLRPDFDEIRSYIRFGVKPLHPIVLVTTTPILQGDDSLYRQTNGHLVVVGWDMLNEGVVCLLSLFNHLTYHVVLCRNYSGVWHPIDAGRHFDLRTRTISEVRGIERNLTL